LVRNVHRASVFDGTAAAGLAAAIPAVLAYNTFTRLNRLINQDMDHFTHDLHAHLLTLGGKDGIR
jgi:biopolymer transport protein ExbB